MKSLSNSQDKAEIIMRLRKLQPTSQRSWGKMNAHQAICHLSDAFKSRFGEKVSSPADTWLTRTVMKWIALQSPLPWPHGVKTRPEMDQEIGGTPPLEFEIDRQQLELLIERFCQRSKDTSFHPHPHFGRMTETEWLRWGYLHCNHHLRQFGV